MSVLFVVTLFCSILHGVSSVAHCDPTCHSCEFWLKVSSRLTMMRPNDKGLVVAEKGRLYPHDSVGNKSSEIDLDDVVTANGWNTPRVLNLFNGTLPGPTMVVYEGQEVIVNVKNGLLSESITLHFHGLWQESTPWMDGVAYITQCPIMAGQSFTYRFKVRQHGTYWYHSHLGLEIPMGMYGAFIIRQRNQAEIPKSRRVPRKCACVAGGKTKDVGDDNFSEKTKDTPERNSDRPPRSDCDLGRHNTQQEFVMSVASHNHEWDAMTDFLHMYQGIFVNGTLMQSPRAYDGAYYSPQRFNSVLINGRGRYRDPESGLITESPLFTFTVRPDSWVRFRLIGVETQIPFEVSVDDHMLYVVALDGQKIQNVAVHSVVIAPGERVDFFILTRQDPKNYWIRAVPMVVDKESNYGEAILSYDGADTNLPDSVPRKCTEERKCLVLNCPFYQYPSHMNKRCVHTDSVRRMGHANHVAHADRQIFLNFMIHPEWSRLNSINGRSFKLPTVAALVQPKQTPEECPANCSSLDGDYPTPCHCYHKVKIRYGETVQMVLTNIGVWNRAVHPLHLHGHHFHVLKIGYGETDPKTGLLVTDNRDILCQGHDPNTRVGCTSATWRNSTWGVNDIPGLNLHDPPLKDTIVVPSGGYVVIRFTANNPGLWFLHCHTSAHYVSGMALVIEEALDKMPHPPKDFPKCGDYLN